MFKQIPFFEGKKNTFFGIMVLIQINRIKEDLGKLDEERRKKKKKETMLLFRKYVCFLYNRIQRLFNCSLAKEIFETSKP